MNKVLDIIVPLGATFGPLLMTNICGIGRGGWIIWAGVILVAAAMVMLRKSLESQRREINLLKERLDRAIGSEIPAGLEHSRW